MMTRKEGDGEHPSSHYLVVEDAEKPSTWHLRVRGTDGKPDHNLMGDAWAALHGGYRGNKYEGPGKAEAIGKLKGLYKSEGMELPSETQSEILLPPGRDQDDRFPTQDDSGPRFVALLAEPPATGLIRIPIAMTGTWGGAEKKFSIGLDDLNEIRENFAKKPTGEINVDYEHASEVPFGTGGPVLSAGRIVKFDPPEPFGNGKLDSCLRGNDGALSGMVQGGAGHPRESSGAVSGGVDSRLRRNDSLRGGHNACPWWLPVCEGMTW